MRDRVTRSIDFYAEAFGAAAGLSWSEVTELAPRWLPLVEAFNGPELVEELEGIAEGAAVSLADVLALNGRGDLSHTNPFAAEECSAWALTDEATPDGHVYCGQNWDWRLATQDTVVMLRIEQPGKPTIVMQTEAGQIGRQGANSAGLALNATGLGPRWGEGLRLPQPYIRRRILDSWTMNDALTAIFDLEAVGLLEPAAHPPRRLRDRPRDDARPSRLGLPRARRARPHEPLRLLRAAADRGDYRPASADSLLRLERIESVLGRIGGTRTGEEVVALVREAMTDHFSFPNSVCNHPDERDPELARTQTVASTIVDLTTGEYRLAHGPPCENEYELLPWNLYDGDAGGAGDGCRRSDSRRAAAKPVENPAMTTDAARLREAARDHLWLHFTRMGGYADGDVPVIVRGDGCYLEDVDGKRYLDALAGLFAVNIGYGYGEEIGRRRAEQMRELPFYTNWTYAHPRAIELAAEVAALAPGDLNRVFFVSGGSEAVEAAWKLARQYHAARGERRWKAIGATIAYHGTTMGALSINGIAALRAPFEPLVPDVVHVRNTNRYHRPHGETEEEFTAFLLEDLDSAIVQAGPETVAMVIMEPVQNSGGSFTPPAGYFQRRPRDLRPLRDPALRRRGDHRLRPRRRLVRLRAVRHPARPRDLREGTVVLVRADRRRDRDRRGHRAVPRPSTSDVRARDHLRRPSGAVRGRAQEHRDHEARADRRARGRERGARSARRSRSCWSCRSSATFAAPATSARSSSSRTRRRSETFSDEECEWLLRGFLSPRLFERGLICRADDRGDPVDPDLAAARRRPGAVRRDRRHPRRRARRGREARQALAARDRRRRLRRDRRGRDGGGRGPRGRRDDRARRARTRTSAAWSRAG